MASVLSVSRTEQVIQAAIDIVNAARSDAPAAVYLPRSAAIQPARRGQGSHGELDEPFESSSPEGKEAME